MKLRIGLIVAVVAAAIGISTVPSSAAITCGATITKSIKLTKNLKCTTGDGIVIGAPNISVNLNGNTLSTSDTGSNDGVYTNGFPGITVKNGTIKNFNRGVNFFGTNGGTVKKVTTVEDTHGVSISNSAAITVSGNNFKGGDASVLANSASTGLTIVNNKMTPGAGSGVRLNGTTHSYVANNTITNGGDRGIYLLGGANFNDIYNNVIKNPTNDGIQVDNSTNNTIDSNKVTEASEGIALNATSLGSTTLTQLLNNTTNNSDDDGIFVALDATSTTVNGNTANTNLDNGIQFDSTSGTVSNNTANNNGNDGIILANSGNDGGGNTATGNGGTDCVNAAC